MRPYSDLRRGVMVRAGVDTVSAVEAILARAQAEGRDLTRREQEEIERMIEDADRALPQSPGAPEPNYYAKLRLQLMRRTHGRR